MNVFLGNRAKETDERQKVKFCTSPSEETTADRLANTRGERKGKGEEDRWPAHPPAFSAEGAGAEAELRPGPRWGPAPCPLSNLRADLLTCPGLAELPQRGWHSSRALRGVDYSQWTQLVFLGIKA